MKKTLPFLTIKSPVILPQERTMVNVFYISFVSLFSKDFFNKIGIILYI